MQKIFLFLGLLANLAFSQSFLPITELKVKTKGWKVYLEKKFLLTEAKDSRLLAVFLNSQGIARPQFLIFENGQLTASNFLAETEKYFILMTLPEFETPFLLRIHQVNGKEKHRYALLLPEVYYPPEELSEKFYQICGWHCLRMLSEIEIEPKDWYRLAEIYRFFLPLFARKVYPRVYLTESKSIPGENYYQRPRAVLSGVFVILPEAYLVKGLGEYVLFHELAHFAFYNLITQNEAYFLKMVLLFQDFLQKAGVPDLEAILDDQVLRNYVRSHKIFQLLKESEYFPKREAYFGHPYENSDEFFASLMTIRYFFAEELKKRACATEYAEFLEQKFQEFDELLQRATFRQILPVFTCQ